MEIASLLVSVGVALAAIVAILVAINTMRIWRMRLQPMRVRAVPLTRVPPKVRAALDAGRLWLLPRGFRYVGSSAMTQLIEGTGERYSDLYQDEASGIFAAVSMLDRPQAGELLHIEFQAVYADGRALLTTNRHRHDLPWEPPAWEVHDDYLPDFAEALERHRGRVAAAGGTPLRDPEARAARVQPVLESYLDEMIARGVAQRGTDGETRFRLLPAMRYVARFLKGNWRASRVKAVALAPQGAPVLPAHAASAGLAADIQAYKGRRAARSAMSGKGKWKLGALSAVAFIALGALLWDWTFAVSVLAVIAFHEGGHYAAMKWVGYRNLNVFFVPGLGGLATGEKQDATAGQKMLVYLAGPVPGIAVATAALIAMSVTGAQWPEALVSFLTIMLVINVLNLLPVTPLDGGRVLEVLLFVRWPTLRFAFAAGSTLLLLAGGYFLGERVMLVFGILLAISLPHQWRYSRLARRVKRAPGEALDERSAVRRVFEALAAPPFDKWNFDTRSTAADELIAELRSPVPRAGVVLGGLALYAACFVAPAVAAIAASETFRETVAAAWEMQEMIAASAEEAAEMQRDMGLDTAPARDWRAELAAAKAQPADRRLALLLEAAEAGYLPDDAQDPSRPYAEIKAIAHTLPQGHPVRARALLTTDTLEDHDVEQRRDFLRRLMQELADEGDEAVIEKARIATRLALVLDPGPERIRLLEYGRDSLKARVPAGDAGLSFGWSSLAEARAAQGDPAAAESEWLALMAWHAAEKAPAKASSGTRDQAELGYLQFLMRQGRWEAAERLARPAAERALAQWDGKRWRLAAHLPRLQALFWMSASRGDAVQAGAWLKAWEQALPPGSARRNPHLQVARLALGDAAKDAAGVEDARKRIASLPAKRLVCEPGYALPLLHETALEAHARALLRRHAVCA